MTDRILLALVLALVAVGAVFAIWPDLDLAVTRYVYTHGGFWERERRRARRPRRAAAGAAAGCSAGSPLLALARLRWRGLRAPSWRALAFLAASLTLGSGLIVNLGLKDHSHRPRPVHVREFGGDMAFRPWDRFDGGCVKNCGFASGEAASGFWMVAPALLAPPPLQWPAVAAALAFGVATSALRVAFGGHFLSDVLFGGLISLLVVTAMWRVVARRL